jgi:reverse gyrase
MRHKVIESCQNCGVELQSQRELNAWLCLDCLDEDADNETDYPDPLYEPDCDQCGGPTREGFCRTCQA